MIPGWLRNGDLPPGVHFATLPDIEERLSFNARRHRFTGRLPASREELRRAGCRLVYLDGSFITRKANPGDFDACWDIRNVAEENLDAVFWDFSNGRAAQKSRFQGELFPAQLPEGATGKAFVEFFQVNRLTGERKRILAIRLRGARR